MLVNEFTERNGHLLLDGAWVVHVAGDTEELGALITLAAETCEPVSSASANGGRHSDGLDIGDGGGASEKTDGSRERRLETRLSGLTLQGFNERGLLTTHICAHSSMDEDVEIIARATGVLADQASLVCLLDGTLQYGSLVVELSSDVDVCGGGVHSTPGDEAALDELVGVLAHDLTVLAGSGLSLIGIDNEITGLCIVLPALGVHERLRWSALGTNGLLPSVPISIPRGSQHHLGLADPTP